MRENPAHQRSASVQTAPLFLPWPNPSAGSEIRKSAPYIYRSFRLDQTRAFGSRQPWVIAKIVNNSYGKLIPASYDRQFHGFHLP